MGPRVRRDDRRTSVYEGMETQVPVIWKVVIVTIVTNSMSSIIPVDLVSFATDPSYLNTLVTTNVSNLSVISLLAYDETFASVIGENATARQLHNLDWQAFHEAGVYNRDAQKLYVTSSWVGDLNNPINVTIIDLANNYSISSTRYSALAEANGATSYYPPGTQTNGSTPSRVLYCDQGDLVNPAGLVSVDPVTGDSQRILTNFLGRNFSSLNDARQHPVTGDIWFTDPDYGYVQGFRPAPSLPKQIYRFNPASGEIAVVADDFTEPNGLEFSPDYKTLYVSDTGAAGYNMNLTRPATLYAFDITDDGKRLAGRRIFAYSDNGIPDGLHTDTDGNVWAGCGDGIHVWNAAGTLIGKIWVGVTTSNFAFLPGAVLVFSNAQLWIVENLKAVGREVSKDFGV
jgi:gluconolactonase